MKANLKQYRKAGSKWQFVPAVKVTGTLDPRPALAGKLTSFNGGGKPGLQ